MSSTPQSPPETPFKGAMAAENAMLTPRSRLPDGAPKGDTKRAMAPPEIMRSEESGSEVQVPATQPAKSPVPHARESEPQTIHYEKNEVSQNHSEHGDEQSAATEDSKAELVPFDWEDLEKRYKEAIVTANDTENELVEEFLRYSNSFSFWADASAQHDNDRAWKRIKTRERYVQLSEESLEEKKKHYVEVVEAFQKALQLLSR